MSNSQANVGTWLVDLIMKPGTSVQLVPAINFTLCLLGTMLLYLVANGESSVHLYVMGGLAVGLMVSINWFISEFNKVKRQQAQEGDGGTSTTSAAASGEESTRPKTD